MEIIKDNVRVCRFVGHENLVELVEGDIIVPDIKPDILSLIKVDGKAFITNKEVQKEKIRLQGVIDIYATYISDDESNSLRSLTATLSFNEIIEVKDAEIGMIPIIKYDLGNIESRVLNGRKITVKCPVEIDIKLIENSEYEIPSDVTGADTIEVLKETVKLNSLLGHNNENVSINETVSLSTDLMPISEILKCSFNIVNKDYKISYNKVLAKADMRAKIIYVADDEVGSVQIFETLIPFTSFIDINGVNDSVDIQIDYNIKNAYIKPVYQDMKANAICIEAEVETLAIASETKEFIIIQDLYNPDAILNYNVKNIEFEQAVKKNCNIVRVEENFAIHELENSRILDVSLRLNSIDRKNMDNKALISGAVIADILYLKADGRTIENRKVDIPFESVVNAEKDLANCEITAQIIDFQYELLSSRQLRLNVAINIECISMNKICINVIDNLEQTTEKLESIASIIIYPVREGDTLWKIAKKYRTTVNAIMKANELNDDKLYIGQQLIIPKRVYKVELELLG